MRIHVDIKMLTFVKGELLGVSYLFLDIWNFERAVVTFYNLKTAWLVNFRFHKYVCRNLIGKHNEGFLTGHISTECLLGNVFY